MAPFSPSGSASAALSSYIIAVRSRGMLHQERHRSCQPPAPPYGEAPRLQLYTTIVSSPYGDHWRSLRRAGAIEIFSSRRLNTFLGTRGDEIKRLLCRLSRNSSQHGFPKVELKTTFSELTFNVIVRMVAGKRYFRDEVSDVHGRGRAVRKIVKEVFPYAGAANPGEFMPVLNWFGNGTYEKRVANSTDACLIARPNQ
ncbi:Cytochrome P [Parasponia andersonii]|uniref:Cytochrome P n=1 Tax=Parasponia andersonii TaxID=3476 RepID=A0A2P5BMC4_PARAD|nr:Cytochrome P [Parasponia andersonii]